MRNFRKVVLGRPSRKEARLAEVNQTIYICGGLPLSDASLFEDLMRAAETVEVREYSNFNAMLCSFIPGDRIEYRGCGVQYQMEEAIRLMIAAKTETQKRPTVQSVTVTTTVPQPKPIYFEDKPWSES